MIVHVIMFVAAGSEEQVSVLQSRISELEQQLEQQEVGVALQAELDSLKTENDKLRAKVIVVDLFNIQKHIEDIWITQ